MAKEEPPMPGDWHATLPQWKQNAFNAIVQVLGAPLTLWMFGYRAVVKRWFKEHEGQHGNS